jgi:hypothetical protein
MATKTQVVTPAFLLTQSLMSNLYRQYDVDRSGKLLDIVDKNSRACNNSQLGFYFRGKYYHVGKQVKVTEAVNLLNIALNPLMRTFIEWEEKIDTEKEFVKGYLTRIFLKTNYPGDFRRLIPDILHPAINDNEENFVFFTEGMPEGELVQFLSENEKYISIMRTRMTKSLLDIS